MPDQHHSDSFVLRIWREKEENDTCTWRGWAQHATSGEARYFRRLADLLTFIEAHTGPLSDPEAVDFRAGQPG